MSAHQKWHLFRWFAWALACSLLYRESFSVNALIKVESTAIDAIFFYIASGVLLEVLYRKLAWGQLNPLPKTVTQGLPNDPSWIPIKDNFPPLGVEVELFCADGKIRLGRALRHKDGREGLAVKHTDEEIPSVMNNPLASRPTHWRSSNEPGCHI